MLFSKIYHRLTKRNLLVIVFFLLALLSILIFLNKIPRIANAGWFNDSWQYRQRITLTNTNSSNQTYVLVKILTNTDLSALVSAGKLQSSLNDLRFTDSNGKLLSYWIEDATNNSVDIWTVIPSVPSSGTSVYMYYGNPAAPAGSDLSALPTGGTITINGNSRIHSFTTVGSQTFVSNAKFSANILVVGGGGGGGMDMGGGGGGGGYAPGLLQISPGTYNVVVGAGGAGAPAAGTNGQPSYHPFTIPARNGGNSVFATITAYGGGAGGSSYDQYTPGAAGSNGGSGGGASGYSDGRAAGSVTGGTGIAGQGLRGGNQGMQYYSGGGGGAGMAGADGNNDPSGGQGAINDILGTWYYWGGGGGGSGYSGCGGYGGNGGGGGGAVCARTGGGGLNPGSPGGGGTTNSQTNTPGGNGGANTGGGGGGGSHYNANNKGGDGGSGIVVVKYSSSPNVSVGTPTSEEKGTGPVAYWNFDEGYGTTIHNQTETNSENGLVAWYKFNEGSGTNSIDQTGNNNLIFGTGNSAPAWVPARIGLGLSFNGSSSYAYANDSSTLNSTSGTWGFWFKTNQVPSTNGEAIMSKAGNGTSLNGIHIYSYQGKIGLQIYDGTTATGLNNSYATNDNNWHQLYLTYQAGGTSILYIDGKNVAFSNSTRNFTFASGNPLRLARSSDPYWASFAGIIDNVKIYNRILSPAEIASEASSLHGDMINYGSSGIGVSTTITDTYTDTTKINTSASSNYLINVGQVKLSIGTTCWATSGTCNASCTTTSSNTTVYDAYLTYVDSTSCTGYQGTNIFGTACSSNGTGNCYVPGTYSGCICEPQVRECYSGSYISSLGSQCTWLTTYSPSGTIQSTNLLSGYSNVVNITTFKYSLPSLPANTTASIKFSQDASTWRNANGTIGATTPLTTIGSGTTINLTGLNWSGSNFYYQITLSGGSSTPVIDDVSVTYSTPGGSSTNPWNSGAASNSNQKPMGKSLHFDGQTQFIDVPSNASIGPTNAISASGWFKLDNDFSVNSDSNQGIFDKGDYQFYLDKTDGKAKWVVNDAAAKAFSALGVGQSLNGNIYALTVWNGNLIAGGNFTNLSTGTTLNHIAQWDGNAWTALGTGVDSTVKSFAVLNGKLYVGGSFSYAGLTRVNGIAMWDGSWHAVGTGIVGTVDSLAVFNQTLYLGGTFTTLYGIGTTVNSIVRWDGSSLLPLGTGISGLSPNVDAMISWKNNLYVTGYFDSVNGITTNNIAKWDGSTWSSLGTGLDGWGSAMVIWNDRLIISGAFNNAGSLAYKHIAQWDGSNWGTLGAGSTLSSGIFYTMAVMNGNLYGGGNLVVDSVGTTLNYIAKWNGTNWTPLGNGLNNFPWAFTVWKNNLYIGGQFSTANGSNIPYLTQYGTSNNQSVSSTTSSWTADKWYHYTTTYNGSNLKLYINGILENTSPAPPSLAAQLKDLYLGKTYGSQWTGGSGEFFQGYLDETRIYNYALNSAQVAKDYNRSSGVSLGVGAKSSDPGSNGLIAWYKMDESGGNTIYDSSGNNQTGIFAVGSSAPTWTQGKIGKALKFNGAQYATLPLNSLPSVADSITVEFWANVGSSQNTSIIGMGPSDDLTNRFNIHFPWSNNNIYWDFGNMSGGTGPGRMTAPFDPSWFGSWAHYAFTVDPTTGMKIFRNGIQIGSTNVSSSFTKSNKYLLLGGVPVFGGWTGSVDNLKIYNRALSASEIAYEYSQGGPVAYYNFDEGNGSILYDQTTNALKQFQSSDPNLVSYWEFEEYTGTTVYDLKGTNNGNFLVGNSTPFWTNNGRFGRSNLLFNGSTSKVDVPNNNSLNFGSGPFTISTWINRMVTTGITQDIVSKTGADNGGGYKIGVGNAGEVYCQTSNGTNIQSSSTNTGMVNIGSGWHNLIISRSGSSCRIYVDGIDQTTSVGDHSAMVNSSIDLMIGGAGVGNPWGQVWNGYIDSVKIYNRSFSAADVQAELNRTNFTNIGYVYALPRTWSDGAQINTNQKPLGKSLTYNGTTQFATIQNLPALNFNYNQDFSVSYWMKAPSTQNDMYSNQNIILEKWSNSGPFPYAFRIYNQTGGANNGKLQFSRYDGTNNPAVTSNKTVNDNKWHHITGIKNGSNLFLYIDNILSGTATDTTTTTTTNSEHIYLGMRGNFTNYFAGSIDEVKIFSYALSQKDISTEFNRSSATVLGVASMPNDPNLQVGTTSSLLAWYKMDEGTGGSVSDSSGNNQTASCISSPTWVQGKFGKALNFDNVDDGLSIGNQNFTSLSNYSMCAWVNPKGNHLHYTGTILSSGDWNNIHWAFGLNQANTSIDLRKPDGVNYTSFPYNFPLNQWSFVCITRSGTLITANVNGQNIGTYTGTTGNLISNATNTTIGRETYAGGYFDFNGAIDNVKIYNRPLTSAEISAEYNQNKPIVYWRFDEKDGLIAHDDIKNSTTTNLIPNPSFETNTTNWSLNASAAINLSSTYSYFGSKSANVTTTGTGDEFAVNWISGGIIPSNSAVTLSAWVYIPAKNGAPVLDRSLLIWDQPNGISNSIGISQVPAGIWTRVSTSINTGTSATSIASRLYAYNSSTPVYYDNVQLEVRPLASSYCDGSIVGSGNSWTSTPHASSSICRNTFDATLSPNPPTWSPGKQNNALTFNGTNNFATALKLPTLEGANDYSISAWFKTSSNSAQNIISQSDLAGNHIVSLNINNIGGTGVLYYTTYESGYKNIPANKIIADNQWHHVVVTKSGTTGSIYLDGVSYSNTTVNNVTNTSQITIGARENSTNFFNGQIDEIKIYSYALTPSQVLTDYNNNSSVRF